MLLAVTCWWADGSDGELAGGLVAVIAGVAWASSLLGVENGCGKDVVTTRLTLDCEIGRP